MFVSSRHNIYDLENVVFDDNVFDFKENNEFGNIMFVSSRHNIYDLERSRSNLTSGQGHVVTQVGHNYMFVMMFFNS